MTTYYYTDAIYKEGRDWSLFVTVRTMFVPWCELESRLSRLLAAKFAEPGHQI